MALINPVPTTKTLFGTLSVATIFTGREGLVGVSTDDPDSADDYFWLAPGDSIQIPAGLTVHYAGDSNSRAVLHHMPIGL